MSTHLSVLQMVNVATDVRLSSVSLDEPAASESRDAIMEVVRRNLLGPGALLESFVREFAPLVALQVGALHPWWHCRWATMPDCDVICLILAVVK